MSDPVDEAVTEDTGFAPTAAVDEHAQRKRSILRFLVGYAIFLGMMTQSEQGPAVEFLLSLPLLLAFVYWCEVDARQRGRPMGKWMRLALVLFFVLAFPIYAFRSRGLGGFLLLLQAALFFALVFGVMFASAYLVLTLREWRAL